MSSKYLVPSRLAVAITTSLVAGTTSAAVITVDTLADPGDPTECSLRAALESVNQQIAVDGCVAGDGNSDQILFGSGLTGSLALTSGSLVATNDVSIVGPGASDLTIDANGASRVFHAYGYAQVSLGGVTLTGGSASFGAGAYVTDGASLVLDNCIITGNSASDFGGGIEVFGGQLQVNSCALTNNTAAYHGGGIAVTRGEAVVYDTLVTGNSAEVGGGLQVLPPYSYGPVIAAAGRGGGGADGANLIVTQSTISGNQANLIGGGIGAGSYYQQGPKLAELLANPGGQAPRIRGQQPEPEPNLVVDSSTISGNSAPMGGGIGAVSNPGYGPQQNGISYTGPNYLVVQDSTIGQNQADYGGGVGVVYGSGEIYGSQIVDNTATVSGGGVLFANPGGRASAPAPESRGFDRERGYYQPESLQLSYTAVDGNQVQAEERGFPFSGAGGGISIFQGAVYLVGASVNGNSAPYFGGGLVNGGGYAVAFNTVINTNSGGGVYSSNGSLFGTMASTISGNSAAQAGGLHCMGYAQCDIKYSEISDNEGAIAGGVLIEPGGQYAAGSEAPRGLGGNSELFNTTISGNVGGQAGGVHMDDATLLYTTVAFNSQVAANPTGQGGPSNYAGGILATGAAALSHVIVANNQAENGVADVRAGGGPIGMDYSLVGDDSGLSYAGTGNVLNADPLLAPLDFNGSPYTQTHALISGSPAIDAGNPAITDPPDYDQRGPGFARVVGSSIDIGAFEFVPPPPEPDVSLSTNSIDFAGTLVGVDETAQLTLTSTGTADLSIGTISLNSTRGGVFGIINDNCSNQLLPPQADCTLDITFQPLGRGQFDTMVSIPSNAPDSPALVDVTGVGIAPELSIVPGGVDFGDVDLGDSNEGSVELSNVGDADLEITGTDVAPPFAVVAGGGLCLNGGPTVLTPSASCTLTFRFEPAAAGPAGQTVNISSDSLGGDSSVELQGVGIEPAAPPPPAIPVPVMNRTVSLILAGGLLLLGYLGLRRRRTS